MGCSCIGLSFQSLEIVGKHCYSGHTQEARGNAVDNIIRNIWNLWSKFLRLSALVIQILFHIGI